MSHNGTSQPVSQQLVVADVAWIFQCDERTIRAGCKRKPPEITHYKKFGRTYFAPEDVLSAIAASKRHALHNSEGHHIATDVDKLYGRLRRFVWLITRKDLKQFAPAPESMRGAARYLRSAGDANGNHETAP